MRWYLLLLLLFVVPTTAQEQPAIPRFEQRRCEHATPRDVRAVCGVVIVLEDRSDSASPTLELPVVIILSESDTPAPDPIVSLTGGPGASTTTSLLFAFRRNYYAFLENRDFIMFDQRGVTTLDCPDLIERRYAISAELLSLEEQANQEAADLLNCHETLVAAGYDLPVYTTLHNAADLEDMRQAIGYDEWNLFGVSYGTKLALTTMRDAPQGLRSVILDSVYPLQANLYTDLPISQQRSFDLLFARCAEDATCNTAYPELQNRFYDLITTANAEPILIRARHSQSGERFEAYVDGQDIASRIFNMLYVKDLIPYIPQLIDRLANGNYNDLPLIVQNSLDSAEGISEGMYYSVQCGEEAAFTTLDAVHAAAQGLNPALQDGYLTNTRSLLNVCAEWATEPADPRDNQAVMSDIPTLVLSGEFDPITPPQWGQLVADDLPNSFFYVFPAVGHGQVRSDECALQIALQFVDDPTTEPDSACIATLPAPQFITD